MISTWKIRGKQSLLTAAAAGLLLLTSCTFSAPTPPGSSGGAASNSTASATSGADIAKLVDIGHGRQIYLECRGSGSPTALLISGTGGGDEWMSVLDSADPQAPPTLSTESVFDTLARTGRVCAYDRPGTTLSSGAVTPSTLVPQPTTAEQGVDDLHAVLKAAEQPGPYVVVGASLGGLIAQLFARTYPQETTGIALVDAASAFLKDTLTPTQWSNWMAAITAAHTTPGAESPDYDASLAEVQAAGGMPQIPAVVLSSDHPWDLGVTPGESTWPAWLAAQDQLARSLTAVHISNTDSGHGIAVEQPALVAGAIRGVVENAQ